MPDHSEPPPEIIVTESLTSTNLAVSPVISVAAAWDAFPGHSSGTLDNFTCNAGSDATPDVVLEPPEPKPDNPPNPPNSTDR